VAGAILERHFLGYRHFVALRVGEMDLRALHRWASGAVLS
jgi:hypothetical protein